MQRVLSAELRQYASAVMNHWYALVLGAASLCIMVIQVAAEATQLRLWPWWANLIVFALAMHWGQFLAWRDVKRERDELTARLVPRIKLIEVLEHERPIIHGYERSFDLCVQASEGADLDNCLVRVEKLEALDGTKPYTTHLPMALRTARNVERDGGGPFRLRPTQMKKVPLCTRIDGFPSEIAVNYERPDDSRAWAYSLRNTRDFAIEIALYGPPAPTERVRLRCTVDDDGKLNISRSNA